MGEVELYSYYRSSCSWRIRLVLAIKGIDYKYHPVHLLKGEQRDQEYHKKNPFNKVPTLVHNGNPISQTQAICEYLEEVFPGNPILPKDPKTRAIVREISAGVACDVQPLQNSAVLSHIGQKYGEEEKLAWARKYIEEGLQAVNELVEKHGGKYCVGDEITMADAFVVPQLYNARRYDADTSKFPRLIEVDQRLAELDAFKAANPKNQPDTPAETA
eukprot:Clim_evm33s152 gene=Clim_evmTU33s152